MILVADSGSSKTDWRLLKENGEITPFETIGLHPLHHSPDSFVKAIGDGVKLEPSSIAAIERIYFYGAGCSNEAHVVLAKESIEQFFPNSEVFVYHDMLGAARASCGNQAGLSGILGTGSNCCLFDGKEVVAVYPSSGYLMGG